MLWIARSLGCLSEPITMKAPISVHHNARKQMFYGSRTSEAWFPTYSLLSTKENAQSVHLEHQYRMSHFWTVTAWFAGNFQVSYGSSGIHSVSVFANPRRLWLCSTNNRLQTCPEIKIFRALCQWKEQTVLLVHFVLSIAAETRCSRITELQEENAWSTNMYEP